MCKQQGKISNTVGRLVKLVIQCAGWRFICMAGLHAYIYFIDKPKQKKNNMLIGNEWICEPFLLEERPILPSVAHCPLFSCCIY